MNDDNKPHWMRFFAFIGILIVSMLLLNILPKQERAVENIYWKYFYEKLPEKTLDIVFLGNSHAQCTFIPEIINKVLGVESFNLITPGESVHLTKYEYREVLRYQNPKAVVIETGVIYSGKNQDKLEPFQYSFFDSMPFSLRKLVYIHDFFSYSNLIKYYFPFTMVHAEWKTPAKPINRLLKSFGGEKTKVGISNKGYYQIVDPILPDAVRLGEVEENENCPIYDLNERLASAEDIIQFNKPQSSKLIFIEAPTFPKSHKGCESQSQALFAKYEVSNYQLFSDTDPSLLWFHDASHLTQFGAIIASLETARLLSYELNISMDADMLAFFESYKFQGYTIDRNGKNLAISLMPFDEEAANNLTYSWQVIWKGKPIYEEDIQGDGDFAFTLPEPEGDYLIKVKINNPAGAYSLGGEFFTPGSKDE